MIQNVNYPSDLYIFLSAEYFALYHITIIVFFHFFFLLTYISDPV